MVPTGAGALSNTTTRRVARTCPPKERVASSVPGACKIMLLIPTMQRARNFPSNVTAMGKRLRSWPLSRRAISNISLLGSTVSRVISHSAMTLGISTGKFVVVTASMRSIIETVFLSASRITLSANTPHSTVYIFGAPLVLAIATRPVSRDEYSRSGDPEQLKPRIRGATAPPQQDPRPFGEGN